MHTKLYYTSIQSFNETFLRLKPSFLQILLIVAGFFFLQD